MWPELPPNMATGSKGEHPMRQSQGKAVSPFLTQSWKNDSITFTTFFFLEARHVQGKGSSMLPLAGGVSKNLQTCFKDTRACAIDTVVHILSGVCLFTSSIISLKEH